MKFIAHEVEQTFATGFALIVAVLLGAVSFAIDKAIGGTSFGPFVPIPVGIAVIVLSPWLLQRLRTGKPEYTRGDWATVILMELFGWLGIWFVLTNLFLR